MKKIILIGFGGHAKSVADSIERTGQFHIIGYTEDKDKSTRYPYLGTDDILPQLFNAGIRYAAIGIGYLGKGMVREKLYSKLKGIGFELPIIIDPSAIVSNSAVIGEGVFIGKRAVINAEVLIEKMCIINTGAIIEHECQVRKFTHISVGSILCGQVNVGEAAFIGANSVVIQNREVEPREIIPAGITVR